jgi:sulfur carrier protein ThiS adenylyltransferase
MNIFEDALLRYLKPEQLAAIQRTKIGIGGAGGLGSNVAMILVRTGFRCFEILDKDVVEASNLNRQNYALADIGKPKVQCLERSLRAINPHVQLTLHQQKWTKDKAAGLFQDCGIMVEAFDKASCKFDFVEYYRARAPYVVSGNGMAGLDITTELSVRKAGNVLIVGDGTTDIADGHPPLAPRVIECAAKMAGAILQLILEQSHPAPDRPDHPDP